VLSSYRLRRAALSVTACAGEYADTHTKSSPLKLNNRRNYFADLYDAGIR